MLDGPGAGVNFKVPLKPEYGQLKLAMQMKVTGVTLGKESWETGGSRCRSTTPRADAWATGQLLSA